MQERGEGKGDRFARLDRIFHKNQERGSGNDEFENRGKASETGSKGTRKEGNKEGRERKFQKKKLKKRETSGEGI